MLTVERRCDVDLLREKNSTEDIRCSVDVIETVESRNAHFLDRDTVDFCYELVVEFWSLCVTVRHIKDRTDLVCTDDRITCRSQFTTSGDSIDGNLRHLADLLLKSHTLKDLLNLCLESGIIRDSWLHLR